MSSPQFNGQITLYSDAASDASCRVRIALALKGLHYELKEINSSKERLISSINPAQTVPTLVVSYDDRKESVVLTDSITALEYLEEAFPHTTSLLPPLSRPEARAQVRALVNVIAADTHPLTRLRVGEELSRLYPLDDSSSQMRAWHTHWIRRGLSIYEQMILKTAGVYSVGDQVTLADLCLWPQASTAVKLGETLAAYPRLASVMEKLNRVPSFAEDSHVDAPFGSTL